MSLTRIDPKLIRILDPIQSDLNTTWSDLIRSDLKFRLSSDEFLSNPILPTFNFKAPFEWCNSWPPYKYASVLPSDLIALNFIRNIRSNDIFVGKLFDSKYNLILEVRKVSFRDKFDFKVARFTSTRFEAHCTSMSCKLWLRVKRASNQENVCWVVMRCDDTHTHRNEPKGHR